MTVTKEDIMEIKQSLRDIKNRQDNIDRRLLKIEIGIYGNGTKGMATRMTELEDDIAKVKKALTTVMLIGVALGVVLSFFAPHIHTWVAKLF